MESQNNLSIRQVNKLETRSSLLQEALDVFIEKGFEAASVNEIAQKAGVAVGTIYFHFGDKDGLLNATLENLANNIFIRVENVYQKHPTALPEDLARMHIEQIIQFIEENKKIAPFVFGYAISHHPAGAKIIDFMVNQIEENIRLGQADGIYRTDILPHLAARAEVHMNLGLISWWIEHPDSTNYNDIVDTLVKIRLSGLYLNRNN